MYWISSGGGPLVVLPKKELRAWRGAAHGGGDYELACSVDDYAGVVDWGGQNVLVLGDEPHQTAVKVTHQGVVLIRWMHSPDEASILKCLKSKEWGAPAEELEWVLRDAEHVLVDSAIDGNVVQDRIDVPLRAGKHKVSTYVVKPSPDVGAVIHDIQAL